MLALLGEIPWKPVAIAGICIIAYLFIGKIIADEQAKGKLAAQLDQAIDVGNHNAEQVEQADKRWREANDVAAATAKKAAEDHRRFERERLANAHVKPSENGPIAPVLRRELDRLPHAAPSGDNPNGDNPGDVPLGTVPVPRAAGRPST
jgi:hypothetical protein